MLIFSTTTDLFLICQFLSKILEKVVAGQINEHLLINNLHDKFQVAYRTTFSTETALIKITDDILYALYNKSFAAFFMIDKSATFDTVDHIILPNRLSKCFEIDNIAHSRFKPFLSKRSQCVYVNNCVSEPCFLSISVPKGSVLVPLLVTLYINCWLA